MSTEVNDDQIELLLKKLQEMGEIEKTSVRKSQKTFLDWLGNLGMHSLAIKLAHSEIWDKVWNALTNVLDFISEGFEAALGWLAESLGLSS
jgi:hypothetical protein